MVANIKSVSTPSYPASTGTPSQASAQGFSKLLPSTPTQCHFSEAFTLLSTKIRDGDFSLPTNATAENTEDFIAGLNKVTNVFSNIQQESAQQSNLFLQYLKYLIEDSKGCQALDFHFFGWVSKQTTPLTGTNTVLDMHNQFWYENPSHTGLKAGSKLTVLGNALIMPITIPKEIPPSN